MRITSCGITDVGVKRTNNEDNYLINDELNLFVVCDGMGGHAGGEFASAIAVNTVEEVLSDLETSPEIEAAREEGAVEVMRERLRYAIRLAGKRIFEKANAEPEYRGMGTTCLVLLVDGSNAFVAHVGDSRGYIVREGRIEQLTEDHSLVNERIRAGLLTPEQARHHKLKNIITRSLGYTEDVEIDIQVRALRRGDRFLLCSDGLSNLVEPAELGEAVRSMNPQEAARHLVQLACARGGDDNITAVITRVDELA
ncbi:MAG: Stp1/IreP family PP2C-type Ser/Thr phosphatase [Myxococcota bacterium]|jgi:serine/threonine protein phosphatase PrpC|nr:Stp1/IreP family PP2C-type Ser/Thr phosphatase [Pseudomonadota bacterium]